MQQSNLISNAFTYSQPIIVIFPCFFFNINSQNSIGRGCARSCGDIAFRLPALLQRAPIITVKSAVVAAE
jgi:hypothetical protein